MLEGVVTNVANFGAFVDIGVHQDGLVHVSQLADRFVKDPREVVKAGDIVKVKVVEVDLKRQRIALTMKLQERGHRVVSGCARPKARTAACPGTTREATDLARSGVRQVEAVEPAGLAVFSAWITDELDSVASCPRLSSRSRSSSPSSPSRRCAAFTSAS